MSTEQLDPRVDATVPGPADLHQQRLLLLAGGIRLASVVYALAALGVADHLAGGPRPVGDLATACGADASALFRLLRCASAVGIFAELPDGRFALTPLAEGLRSGVPESVRPLVLYNGAETLNRPYAQILHSARTGEPAVEAALGAPLWRYLDEHPAAAEFFDRTMTGMSDRIAATYLAQVDPGRFRRFADIGGGQGLFLATLLRHNPQTTGVLVERPAVTGAARALLAREGVADRATVHGADMFCDALPDDCDAYVLMAVLHNWPDDRAAQLLRQVRAAIGARDARLFVLEQVVGPPNRWDHAKFLDIDMLVIFGGRERTRREWVGLFEATGFELVGGDPPVGRWTTLECRPR